MIQKQLWTLVFVVVSACCAFGAVEKTTIKIGIILPLTGDNAATGEDIRNGFLLAKNQINSPDYEYDLIFEDDQLEAQKAVLAPHKLLSSDKVDVIFSVCNSAEAVAPIAEKANKLHFAIRWIPDVAEKHRTTFTHETTYKAFAQ